MNQSPVTEMNESITSTVTKVDESITSYWNGWISAIVLEMIKIS